MSLGLLPRYVRDSLRAYWACAGALGFAEKNPDLFTLLRAARSGAVGRQDELLTEDGARLRYRVHGAGYSITELDGGRQTDFDVCMTGEKPCLRFTLWHLQQYAASIGEDATRDALGEELGEPDAAPSGLIHVTEGGSDYYYYPMESVKTDACPIVCR